MFDSIIIAGATATGKTKVSIELCKKLNGKIVNADSMYIYKDLNIGTAKPTAEEMDGVQHYLIDFVDSVLDYNVVDFRNDAKKAIAKIQKDGFLPIIVGGTGYYIESLINSFSYGNSDKSDAIREQLNKELSEKGKEYLYEKLKSIDSVTASKLHVNDTHRIIRALEINLTTNKTVENANTNSEEKILKNPLFIGLNFDRALLYKKINDRVDTMFEMGLLGEVKSLYDLGLTPEENQSMRGIGYKELVEFFRGEIPLDEAKESIKKHTRNYAKRQITWFRRYKDIVWLDSSKDGVVQKIVELYNQK